MTFIHRLDKGIALVSKILVYISGACLIFMMAATMVDVIVRTCGGSIIGVYEISEILMVPIVFFALPYVELCGGHAEVDLFFNRIPKKIGRIISVITNLAACGYLVVLIQYGIERYEKLLVSGEHSALLHVPYSLLYILICIGSALAILAILMRTVRLFAACGEPGKEGEE